MTSCEESYFEKTFFQKITFGKNASDLELIKIINEGWNIRKRGKNWLVEYQDKNPEQMKRVFIEIEKLKNGCRDHRA